MSWQNEALYLYCLIPASAADAAREARINSWSPVSVIDLDQVAAVVSGVSLDEFPPAESDREPADPRWMLPRICQHEEVIEAVMGLSPVLPVRFGAVFSSVAVLGQYLRRRHDAIAGFLEDIAGKQELAVKAFLDPQKTTDAVIDSDAGLRARRENLPESPGTRYLLERKLHETAARMAHRWGQGVAEDVLRELSARADKVRLLRLHASAVSGHGGDMILNAAFLLRSSESQAFRGCADRLALGLAPQGIELQCTGPWPPFSFCPAMEDVGT
jgi:hypothetical protein